ncbi:MAG: hypothetical protein QOF72_2940 [Blastocatellia bacterium]|nr:hypothetical protein [Blastocatellia bacterium]
MNSNQIAELIEEIVSSYKENPVNISGGGDIEGEWRYLTGLKYTFVRTVRDISERFKGSDPSSVRILEIGPFLGVTSIALARLGFDVTVTELEEFLAGPALPNRFKKHGIKFFPCNLRSYHLPFTDEEFDLVIMCEILEHLNFNPLPLLKEINRVLRRKGLLYLTVPNHVALQHRLEQIEGRSIHNPIEDYVFQLVPNSTMTVGLHWREYTADEIKEMLEKVSLKVIKQRFDMQYEWTTPRGFRRIVKKAVWSFFNRSVVKKFILTCMFDSGFDPSLKACTIALAVKEKPSEVQFHFTDSTRASS